MLSHRPENASANPADVLRTQDEYLADHARLRGVGHVVTNGPVSDQPDPSLRRLTFLPDWHPGTDTAAREADPVVRTGRLTVEIMTRYCPPGTMTPARPR